MHLSSAIALSSEVEGIVNVSPRPRTLSCGGVVLNLQQRRALAGSCDLGLSPAEFAMVHILFARRDVPMSREAISMELPVRVDPRMVDVYVSRARAKFASAGLAGTIETVSGRGYRAGGPDASPHDPAPAEPPTSHDLGVLVPA